MKPVKCESLDYDNYVYALCRCELPITYAIKMKRVPGKTAYPYKCDICGTSGTLYTKNPNHDELMSVTNYTD